MISQASSPQHQWQHSHRRLCSWALQSQCSSWCSHQSNHLAIATCPRLRCQTSLSTQGPSYGRKRNKSYQAIVLHLQELLSKQVFNTIVLIIIPSQCLGARVRCWLDCQQCGSLAILSACRRCSSSRGSVVRHLVAVVVVPRPPNWTRCWAQHG